MWVAAGGSGEASFKMSLMEVRSGQQVRRPEFGKTMACGEKCNRDYMRLFALDESMLGKVLG